MLNGELAQNARKDLEAAVLAFTDVAERTMELSLELFALRKKTSVKLIPQVENFVNALAATPKEFEKTFLEYHHQVEAFDKVVEQIDASLHDAAVKGGTGAGIGVAAGAATAFAAPTAAMAIATTFGTASTGTAISALGGAAATKAALAWLGGGALAAGGGGMAAGNALLALAGPVGWGLAAICAASGAIYVRSKNASIAEEAHEHRRHVATRQAATEVAKAEIALLLGLTKLQVKGIRSILTELKSEAPSSYREFTSAQKQTLGAVINHVRILGELLNRHLSSAEPFPSGATLSGSNSAA